MNKTIILLIAIACVVSFSCSKEEQTTLDIQESSECVDDVARDYYENLEIIVKSAFVGNSPKKTVKNNPVYEKLASIPIVDAEGKRISFFDLSEDEQSSFFKEYSSINAKELAEKASAFPVVKDYYKAQNAMLDELFGEFCHTTKSDGKLEIDDVESFFCALNEKTEKFMACYDFKDDIPATKAEAVTDMNVIMGALSNIANRGDFILGLPKQGSGLILTSNSASFYKKGHAEIFIKDVDSSLTPTEYMTIGTLYDGVQYRTLEECWMCQFNVLGLRIYDYKWEKLRLKKIERDIRVADIADYAEQYLGRPYVTDSEFLFSKFAAPEHFSCVSLIWWCVKNLYDVEIGSWLLPVISPVELYTSEYTYLKSTCE